MIGTKLPFPAAASKHFSEDLVRALRSLIPIIESQQTGSIKENEIGTLVDRLRAAAEAGDRFLFMSRLVSAKSRPPGEDQY